MSDSPHVITLTTANFEEEVTNFSGTVLVDYHAEWCTPCKMMTPIVAELAKKYHDNKDIKFGSIDVDVEQELAGKYSVLSIPTFIVFKDGEHVAEEPGAMPAPKLEKMLTDQLD